MFRDGAFKVLGIDSGANQNEINKAYQNLMKLVTQIKEARNILHKN
ncbi:DnaJ domain protein [Wolbachia endosymbiont of Drosophila ananassae]|nr:DnaJ domain protein [Wolbachia endosymbiont of Drosophila ananassae]